MGLMDMFKRADINEEVENMKSSKDTVLIDVRDDDEYKSGHIPGSINIPVDEIDSAEKTVVDHDTPILVYCLSGARASRAVRKLESLGYSNVKNIGGIGAYKGKLEK